MKRRFPRPAGGLLGLLCLVLPAVALASAVEVRTLGAPRAPDATFCKRCAVGDHLVTNGELEIVIGGSSRRDQSFYKFPTADMQGSIIFCRPAGTDVRGDVMIGSPYVRIGDTTRHVAYHSVEMKPASGAGDRVVFQARARYVGEDGAKAEFTGTYEITTASGRVGISLTVTNVGSKPIEDFIYALYFDPHQIYDFSPSDAGERRDLPFRVYPRAGYFMGWIDRTPRPTVGEMLSIWDGGMILPAPKPVRFDPGESDSRAYVLIAAKDGGDLLESVYDEIGIASEKVRLSFESPSEDFFEVIVREADSSAVFFRAFLDRPAPLEVALPLGSYVTRANFFPGIDECALSVEEEGESRCHLRDPPSGVVRVRIVDGAGRFVPGKVSFHGVTPTLSPYFRPENPARGDDYWESYKNSVFPGKDGGAVALPVGSYRAVASRGPEYSLHEQSLEVVKGRSRDLVFRIDRIIDRPDLTSLDPHLHTLESDGAVSAEERIRALVAEGVDVAIATDHNLPVDYTPTLERLGLGDYLETIIGTEVTVPERLDYNTYPMVVKPDEINRGAIDSLSTRLSALFAASRARDPGVVIQINHPHGWQYDYFVWHGLDPESAAFAWEGFDPSFDVLEVVNGPDYDSDQNRSTRRDWFNLLRRGYFHPLVGSSDSHEIDREEPGYSRTYLHHPDDRAERPGPRALMQLVRQGRSFASNGPIVDFEVENHARPGDTLTARNGRVGVGIDVWSAPWIEVDRARIYVNGEPRDVDIRPLDHPQAHHLRGRVELRLDRDAYLVAEVRGSRSLSPVVQARSQHGTGDRIVTPYALTNPIFVDVDGNGRFDPPLPHEIEIRPR